MEKLMQSEMAISEVYRAAQSGEHILVICKSRFEAMESASALCQKVGYAHVEKSEFGKVKFSGAGSVEFGWVETNSGRRLDDFCEVTGGIVDAFAKERIPT